MYFVESSTILIYVYSMIAAAVVIVIFIVLMWLLLKKRQLRIGTTYYFDMLFLQHVLVTDRITQTTY